MSDIFWQALIAGVVTLVLAWMNTRNGQKTEEVKKTLESATTSTDSKLGEIHTLVNNNFGVQLKIAAVALRRVAKLTKNKEDIAAARTAEVAYKDHMDKQAVVDGKKK